MRDQRAAAPAFLAERCSRRCTILVCGSPFWKALGELAAPAPDKLRLDKEQKYYLLQTPLAALPLSEAQACRVNASLQDEGFFAYLSPRQAKAAATLFVIESKRRAREQAGLPATEPGG